MADPIQDVPDGYVIHRAGDTWMIFDRGQAADLVRLRLADADARRSLFARAPVRGRGAAPSVEVKPGFDVVLRRYRHGGLLGRFTGALYWSPRRALRELRVTAGAEIHGAPVPHVVCLVLWPVLGPFWSAIIGTREERGARDLLQTVRSTEPAAQRARLAREVGEAIRKLHDAGVDHRDLQLRNIVVAHQKNARRIVIVDLDKAVYHPRGTLPMSARARNLGRLTRSVIKNGLWETHIGEREASAFLEGYTATDPVLRDKLRAWVRRERLKIRMHRLRYRWAG